MGFQNEAKRWIAKSVNEAISVYRDSMSASSLQIAIILQCIGCQMSLLTGSCMMHFIAVATDHHASRRFIKIPT